MIQTCLYALIIILLLGGLFFTFVSSVGVVKLPDVYTRAHMASETDTLGAGLTLLAVALAFGIQTQSILVLIILIFIFLTNPTAAHAIARSAFEQGIKPKTEEIK